MFRRMPRDFEEAETIENIWIAGVRGTKRKAVEEPAPGMIFRSKRADIATS